MIDPFAASPGRVAVMVPIDRPGKIVCVGLNYRDHAEEQGVDLPKEPLFFANIHPNSRCLSLIADWEVAMLKLLARKT